MSKFMKQELSCVEGKFYKKASVVMLPASVEGATNSNTPFVRTNQSNLLIRWDTKWIFQKYIQLGYTPQHIYFITDDPIQEGDWALNMYNKTTIFRITEVFSDGYSGQKGGDKYCTYGLGLTMKKIVATTDQGLNEKIEMLGTGSTYLFNLPRPSNQFLEAYARQWNKGKKVKECLIEYKEDRSKQGDWEGEFIKIAPDRTITCKRMEKLNPRNKWNRGEVESLIIDAVAQSHDWSKENNNVHSIGIICKNFLDEWIENNLK